MTEDMRAWKREECGRGKKKREQGRGGGIRRICRKESGREGNREEKAGGKKMEEEC